MGSVDQEERRQRVRIGLTGLAFVFLLVILGTAISRSGGASDPVNESIDQTKPKDPEDPLAQIGAAPGSVAANETQEEGTGAGQGPKP